MLDQILPPLLGYLYGLCFFSLCFGRESLFIRMLYHLWHVARMHSIENGEKVLTIRLSILRIFILKKLHHLWICLKLWKDVFDRKLIIFGHIDEFASRLWHQRLLPFEHLSDKVPIYWCHWRHQHLNYKKWVRTILVYLRCSEKYWMRSCLEPNLFLSSSGRKASR